MREVVFSAPDLDTLMQEATRLGFVDENGVIIVNGIFESGGGWFLNIVGDVYANDTLTKYDGYWGRLRLNGSPETMPVFSDAITQYVWSNDLGGWTNDGTTLAPEWVNTIGCIA